MKVKVNRTEIETFEGASIKHAVLQYLVRRRFSTSKLSSIRVYDRYGHLTDMDAPLKEGQIVKLGKL